MDKQTRRREQALTNKEYRFAIDENHENACTLVVSVMNLENDDVVDEILHDIQQENNEGTTNVNIRYRGKNPQRWFSMIYPPVLDPMFLRIGLPGGEKVGWISLYASQVEIGRVILSIIIKKTYRNKGIGTVLLQNVETMVADFYPLEPVTEIRFCTMENNEPMKRVAEKCHAKKLLNIDAMEPGFLYYAIEPRL
ncbi:GNAT family N-acetyltransferase [Candidatus Bathyarchaeota archaeon]|nr:GNAT family N-acetyltransferase [Candidatus Bathyarchaeota archaeon]